jgi:hypothetical protein
MRRFLLSANLGLLGACTAVAPPQQVGGTSSDWHEVATAADRSRLTGWRQSFLEAIADARAAGKAKEVDGEGPLLDPDSALPGPTIPNGLYRCRVIKVGAKSTGMLSFIAYPGFRCQVTPARVGQAFAKLSGSQRQVGTILRGDSMRSVFLGTLVLGDESRALAYGTDEQRDVAGYLERIGPQRWRLVMPSPQFESKLDVLELIPAK